MSIRDYKITDEQFNEKGMTSLPDTLNGTPYENKKSLEKFTREVIAPQFNAIVDKFADMEESANGWSAEEAQRVQQENARQSAEQGRVSAEGQRKTSETARLLAEENRIRAENDRVTAETARVNAENKRDSAEKSRVSAENARNVWQTYDAAKTYVPGNKVSFGGSSYVCTAETVGHEPTDTAYWLLIAQKGMDGAGADDLRQINNALDAIDPTKVTTKATPADGDGVMIADSADGGKAKRLLWSSVKTALGKLFVPLARKINGKALSADVTLTGENITVSTTDSTPISGAVKYRTNPNLLDNWFFGRPVNQKGQTEYTVGGAYTLDRWMSSSTDKTIKILDDHIAIIDTADYAAFLQRFDYKGLLGKTVTFSVLAKRTAQGAQMPYVTVMIGNNKFEGYGEIVQSDDYQLSSCTVTLSAVAPSEGYFFVDIVGMAGSSIKILAAKLELGSTQTLAHQDSSGNWILNEIPDFGEQWLRCRRYCKVFPKGSDLPVLAFAQPEKWYLSAFIPFDDMRTVPANNIGSRIKCHVFSIDSDDVSASETIMNWGVTPTGQKLRISDNALSSADFPFRINLDADLIFSADL